ncbi:MAG TPA: hypothetical protein VGR97_03670 [Candidatus Acidoferrales bacterium]|nr:hypothetical protein [Candidatus Acidoferrales bacterium]
MSPRAISVVLVCGLALAVRLSPPVDIASQAGGQATPSAAAPASSQIRFEGEILRGQIYEHDIGHGLVFRLTPATSDEGGGWVIQILPAAEATDETIEFTEIATPPYHAYNDRYLAAAFGYSAREAVQITVRKFYFVQSVEDQHRAADVVNVTFYPGTASEAEKVRAAGEAVSVNLGRGQLRIIHSKVAPGKAGVPDTIAYVKFEVVLDFSPGFTMRKVLAPRAEPARR